MTVHIAMHATSGDYFVGRVRLGSWRQTAKNVIHADTVTGLSGQYASLAEADTAVRASIQTWVAALSEPTADD